MHECLLALVYLTGSILKFPSAMEKPGFSALARPNPNVRTDKVRVKRRTIMKSKAQMINLKQNNKINVFSPFSPFLFNEVKCMKNFLLKFSQQQ